MHSQMSQKKVKATSKIELHTVQIYVQLVWFSPSILLEMRTSQRAIIGASAQ